MRYHDSAEENRSLDQKFCRRRRFRLGYSTPKQPLKRVWRDDFLKASEGKQGWQLLRAVSYKVPEVEQMRIALERGGRAGWPLQLNDGLQAEGGVTRSEETRTSLTQRSGISDVKWCVEIGRAIVETAAVVA